MAKRVWLLAALGAVAFVVAFWLWSFRGRPSVPRSLPAEAAVVALTPAPRGTDWAPISDHPAISRAIEGTDPDVLRAALQDAGLSGLWTEFSPKSPGGPTLPLAERFAAGGVIPGFVGALLTSEGLLFAIDQTTVPAVLADQALAPAAREILSGTEPPEVVDFPAALAQAQPVEVLVMVSGKRGPLLWRSAKSDSLAEGLITASIAARKRWEERVDTMGGPLEERLDQLDVEVALLVDDGTIDPGAVPLIDALVKPVHGVGYEQPTRWRYLLPSATFGAGSPTQAFKDLFSENQLPEDSFTRPDIRLYRLLMRTISVDEGAPAPEELPESAD